MQRADSERGLCCATQDRERDQERLDAKGKTTDGRALRISTVREQWPDLEERYEAKRAADAAKKAGKSAKSAAAPDRATAGMAARMQAFLVPRSVSAPAKAAAGVYTLSSLYQMGYLTSVKACLRAEMRRSMCRDHTSFHMFWERADVKIAAAMCLPFCF